MDRTTRTGRIPSPLRGALLIASLGAAACATSVQPHSMSVPQHEAAAAGEERQAQEHAAQAARTGPGEVQCTTDIASGHSYICWTSVLNPNAEHRREVAEHRRLAAEHRAASQALRDAEARACAGVPEPDRDMSPFSHREDIESVDLLYVRASGGRSAARLLGATVVFRAVPGMTAEWFQRVIDCHLARNAALGHDVPWMPYCPLVLRDVSAQVKSTGRGFVVEIQSDDVGRAREILERAQRLVAP